jgi:hypothetical protein
VIAYWILFAVPAVAALFEPSRAGLTRNREAGLAVFSLFLVAMIGFRYQVGGDWFSYLDQFRELGQLSLRELATAGDPGYALLNWLSARIGGDIWLVNLVCAVLFTHGLLSFVRFQPRPWLALVVAVPYLIIVVAMGYTRQGVAIGCAMAGLAGLTQDRSAIRFVLWVALAATFHKTAVLLIPLAALTQRRGRLWTMLWVAAAAILAYFVFLRESLDHLWYGYIELEYESEGAAIRVAMNALPAAIFLLFRRRFHFRDAERPIWTSMAIGATLFVPLLAISPSSTAVDRLALYLIPIQLLVLCRVPDAIGTAFTGGRKLLLVLIILYAAMVQLIWLNFASHADRGWLPYQSFILN